MILVCLFEQRNKIYINITLKLSKTLKIKKLCVKLRQKYLKYTQILIYHKLQERQRICTLLINIDKINNLQLFEIYIRNIWAKIQQKQKERNINKIENSRIYFSSYQRKKNGGMINF
ncbi:hypothetical protein TTHERM_000799209 (macronuclear) [Tetrahymena thermophila SB210]|uniref:Uncharacterized protein n=1 Tax=Tetrahymena thermophila (strain SB210) TaxID=312017 RepID=W7XGP7_TETTS|nr:hypothetical protein TTHERM_000799209 [Tetrahymena thermophila SB210]EWS73356.1 hypothetical protein TTHERM_000799209 [Tetrahymena thermophila SB210]|eukprot:XP_012654128.1 hypothetical protein TTHERM_000799209 [Tetrahymena thermophila SB210]